MNANNMTITADQVMGRSEAESDDNYLKHLLRAIRGDFGPDYFTPVDLGALYWHLVDLIWIFLFPLLYLIS